MLGFKRRHTSPVSEPVGNEVGKNIVVYNPSGRDCSQTAIRLAKELNRNESVILVEFPCIGIPRLAYSLLVEENLDIPKEKAIDQLLVDYERDNLKAIEDYIVRGKEFDFLSIHPKGKPDLPTLLKLTKNNTLVSIPRLLKRNLRERYSSVIYVLQGQLVHPMTLVSLKQADAIVLEFSDVSETVWNYTLYNKLMEDYGIGAQNMLWYSALKNHEFNVVPVISSIRELIAKMKEVPRLSDVEKPVKAREEAEVRQVGIINPIELTNYRSEKFHLSAEISITDNEKIKSLTDEIRLHLRDHHIDEYVSALFDEEARSKVCYYIADYIREKNDLKINLPLTQLIDIVQVEITEMGVLQSALDDPTISSIEVNNPSETIVEKDGQPVHDTSIRFTDVDHMYRTIDKMLMPMGKTLTANEPIIDSNYRGFRVNIILDRHRGGVSSNSPVISIRKFPPDVYDNESCIRYGNLNQEIVDFKRDVIPAMPNLFVVGGTNSGKTTTLLRFPLFMDPLLRILTIEDSEEMMLKHKIAYQHYPNIAALIVKWHELAEKRQDISKLIKATLRQNPDVIIVGEIRDSDAAEQTIIAANTGHMVATSAHANSAAAGASRFVELMGDTKTAARRVASTIDLIFCQKYVDGKRKITEVAELMDFRGENEPVLNTIFKYDYRSEKFERVGSLKKLREKMESTYRHDKEVIARWCEK